MSLTTAHIEYTPVAARPSLDELHPEAGITPELLDSLGHFRNLGAPEEWMYENRDPNATPEVPMELQNFLDLFTMDESAVITQYMNVITDLANIDYGDDGPNEYVRYVYQAMEKKIMRMVVEKLTQVGQLEYEPDQVLSHYALQGARIFQDIFGEELAAVQTAADTKRIRMRDENYLVGKGEPVANVAEINKNDIKVILLPDDCISTAISQIYGIIDHVIEQGYRPERFVLPVVVATTGGARRVQEQLQQYLAEYYSDINYSPEIIVAAGAICEQVNDKMYLATKNGMYMVGDMGAFNAIIPGQEPTGDEVFDVVAVAEAIANSEFDRAASLTGMAIE